MSDNQRRLTAAETAQTTANLRLASQFVRELIEHPELHEALPDNATVVLLPGDEPGDSELSKANAQMAGQFAANGHHVTTWVVGMPTKAGPQILPRWPRSPGEGAGLTYDRHRDVLTAIFSRTDRPIMPAPMNPHMVVLVDAETRVAVSMTITSFLAVAAQKAPGLVDFLLLPSTQLIGITPGEVREIRNSLTHGDPWRKRKRMTWDQILDELSTLTA